REEPARCTALVHGGACIERLDQGDVWNLEALRQLPAVAVDTQHRVGSRERAARYLTVQPRACERLRQMTAGTQHRGADAVCRERVPEASHGHRRPGSARDIGGLSSQKCESHPLSLAAAIDPG